jgi:hypothetical protein
MPAYIQSIAEIASESLAQGSTTCAMVSPLAISYPDEVLKIAWPDITTTSDFDRPMVFRRKDLR